VIPVVQSLLPARKASKAYWAAEQNGADKMQVAGNFRYLLITLIGFLILTALQAEYPILGKGHFVTLALEMTLIIGIWSIVHVRKWFGIGMALVVISIICFLLQQLAGLRWAEYINMLAILLFYSLTTILAFKAMMTGNEINSNKIMGSICVYLLVGISWGILYYFEFLLNHEAFRGLGAGNQQDTVLDLLYYSYVTISTLGYGDITPISPVARTLAYIEALFGQFYIAILVAGFVGLGLTRGNRSQS
jgi:voltage-gated potassium channel